MKEVKSFNTMLEAKNEKKKRKGLWRPLHTDFIDKKIVVTFVNGSDDSGNIIDENFLRKKELTKKLKDNSINFEEVKEYLRLTL